MSMNAGDPEAGRAEQDTIKPQLSTCFLSISLSLSLSLYSIYIYIYTYVSAPSSCGPTPPPSMIWSPCSCGSPPFQLLFQLPQPATLHPTHPPTTTHRAHNPQGGGPPYKHHHGPGGGQRELRHICGCLSFYIWTYILSIVVRCYACIHGCSIIDNQPSSRRFSCSH